jgi:hypothetical protein
MRNESIFAALLLLAAFSSPLSGAEIHLAVFPKDSAPQDMELKVVSLDVLKEMVQAVAPSVETRKIQLSPEDQAVNIAWKLNEGDYELIFRAAYKENLRIALSLKTSSEATYFGAPIPTSTKTAAGEMSLPKGNAYIIDAGNLFIVIAPPRGIPLSAPVSSTLTATPTPSGP